MGDEGPLCECYAHCTSLENNPFLRNMIREEYCFTKKYLECPARENNLKPHKIEEKVESELP